jgi:uncharacterized protein YbaP (TraB family)
MIGRFAAGLFAIALSACAPTTASQEAFNPALFVARDADSTLYLYGTVHVRRPGEPWGGANAQAALAEADEVWTELEISPEADAEAQVLVMRLGMAPADDPLSGHLTPEENERLAGLAQRYNLPVSYFDRMRPWLAAITLTILPLTQSGYAADEGVDRAIDAAADAQGKQRRAFEGMEEQLNFLAGMSPELQHQMLVETIAEAEEGAAQLDTLSDAWRRGDLEALEHYVIDDTRREYPEMYETLFVQRNAAWMDTLMAELEGSGVDFVAVGAGHLLGEHGLVAQLRARGVRVERVSPAE